jgi:hypothetical protein
LTDSSTLAAMSAAKITSSTESSWCVYTGTFQPQEPLVARSPCQGPHPSRSQRQI